MKKNTIDYMERINAIDLNVYLKQNGFTPLSADERTTYYRSPFADPPVLSPELNPPLLKVLGAYNVWTCSATGYSGNVIDLDRRLKRCNVEQTLDNLYSLAPTTLGDPMEKPVANYMVILSGPEPIRDKALLHFLQSQQLDPKAVSRDISQFSFMQRNIFHTGIGAKMDSGNPLVYVPKLGLFHQDNSFVFIDKGAKQTAVYTSIPDMLHSRQLRPGQADEENVLLLSSVRAFDRARPILDKQDKVSLHFPRCEQHELYLSYARWLHPRYQEARTQLGNSPNIATERLRQLGFTADHHQKGQSKGNRI